VVRHAAQGAVEVGPNRADGGEAGRVVLLVQGLGEVDGILEPLQGEEVVPVGVGRTVRVPSWLIDRSRSK
jgi:hypothetical protein